MKPPESRSATSASRGEPERRGGIVRRASWLDYVVSTTGGAQSLSAQTRRSLSDLDEVLFDAWGLGDNIILVWARVAREYRFLVVRHYAIIEAFDSGDDAVRSTPADAVVNEILAKTKFVPPDEFDRICRTMGKASRVITIEFPGADLPDDALVTKLVTRYGVSLVRERAVLLLDAVGFTLRSPLEQVAMLNSLSYSVNSAHRQLQSTEVDINFARTTTGDGFYIWNRAQTVDANMALYKLMMLILSDNAVAKRKAKRFPVPSLRAAFHVGEHYEFYQVEALNPTTFGYIVGQVTVDLSRIIERALPGQILLGDFNIKMHDADGIGATRYKTLDFVDRTVATLDQLEGLQVAEDRVKSIRCYLTGAQLRQGGFSVNRYQVSDKHGLRRSVYNAKINIHLHQDEPIYLGIQHNQLHPPGASEAVWP